MHPPAGPSVCPRIPCLSFKIPLKGATASSSRPRCFTRRVREEDRQNRPHLLHLARLARSRSSRAVQSIIHSGDVFRDGDNRDKIALISGRALIRSTCARACGLPALLGEPTRSLSARRGSARLGAARRNFRQYPSVTVFITHVKYEPLPVDPRHPLACPPVLQRECSDSKCRQANSPGP